MLAAGDLQAMLDDIGAQADEAIRLEAARQAAQDDAAAAAAAEAEAAAAQDPNLTPEERATAAAAAAEAAKAAATRVAAAEAARQNPAASHAGLQLYAKLLESVADEVLKLRVVLEAAEAKEREREWLSNQLSGDLDDSKIVDGASGERRVYRKRGEPEKKLGLVQRLPKRIVFAVDLSASMARMNSWDGRLDRMASGVVMLLEALGDPNFSHKFDYCITGHSGTR